jgi:hypothetical protein
VLDTLSLESGVNPPVFSENERRRGGLAKQVFQQSSIFESIIVNHPAV